MGGGQIGRTWRLGDQTSTPNPSVQKVFGFNNQICWSVVTVPISIILNYFAGNISVTFWIQLLFFPWGIQECEINADYVSPLCLFLFWTISHYPVHGIRAIIHNKEGKYNEFMTYKVFILIHKFEMFYFIKPNTIMH